MFFVTRLCNIVSDSLMAVRASFQPFFNVSSDLSALPSGSYASLRKAVCAAFLVTVQVAHILFAAKKKARSILKLREQF